MKKLFALILSLAMVMSLLAGCSKPAANDPSQGNEGTNTQQPAGDEEKSIGFVLIGLGGEFFQALADTFEKTFTDLGWEASYVDGKFDPAAQIEAVENYVAQGVDVLVLWSISGEALGSAAQQARDAGVKVVSFVEQLPEDAYDVSMLNDDVKIATNCAKLAAKWVDETFPDAAPGSIKTAVISYTAAENNTIQSKTLEDIVKYTDKVSLTTVYEVSAESTADGLAAAENLYMQDPEIKLFLTAQNGVALGINNYYTSLSSPVTDYSDMGIFTINGSEEVYNAIAQSKEDKSPLRGTVMTGSVQDTVDEIVEYATGIYDGTTETGSVFQAANVFIFADTVDEYLETGAVTSFTEKDIG